MYMFAGVRFEENSYRFTEGAGIVQVCATYRGKNVQNDIEVTVNLRQTSKL